MKNTTTTTTKKFVSAEELQTIREKTAKAESLYSAPVLTVATANRKEETENRLNALMEKRNDLIKALEINADIFRADFENTVHELCETVAQIAVYKTLLNLANNVVSFNNITETETEKGKKQTITTSGADLCQELYYRFAYDMHLYKTGDITGTYSDAMDLFTTAYMEIWKYLKSPAPLTLNDTVYTKALKKGAEKNYTLFQTACKEIREYIRAWSKSDNYKKLHYIVGFTDKGEQVTTSKRPQDDLADITAQDRKKIFNKYGLTAREQEVLHLVISGENGDSIAVLLGISRVTAFQTIARAKAKFVTASAYAEYITAKNAEKVARAKAEKHKTDKLYQRIYAQAQDRTAKALEKWKREFYKEMKKDR
jgi:DNA-binding CsgD family transcriptional regulator